MRVFLLIMGLLLSFHLSAGATLTEIEAALMSKDYVQVRDKALAVIKDSSRPEDRLQAQYYFGLAKLRLGQYQEARHVFQQVIDAHPALDLQEKALLSVIEGFYLEGLYTDALEAADQLLQKNTHSSFLSLIYYKIAGADLKLMRWEEAGKFLNKIINEFPQSPEALGAKQLLEEKQYFAVQVGSFLDQGRALSLIDALKGSGQYAYVVETLGGDGQKHYRVRVGQTSSLKNAEDLKKRLEALGYPTLIYP